MKRALVSAAITAAAVSFTAAPAFAASSSASAQPSTYTIQWGDTLSGISQRFGVNMYNLAAYNHLWVNGVIYAGATLRIPPAGWAPTYTAPVTTTSYVAHSDDDSSYSAPSYSAPATTSYSSSYSAPAASSSGYSPSGVWACIAQHESGGNPATNTGNGYYGMYQFTLGSWAAAGGTGNPANASAAEQTAMAQRLQQIQGWGAWPVTSRECGA